jgi:hypothetical protein
MHRSAQGVSGPTRILDNDPNAIVTLKIIP